MWKPQLGFPYCNRTPKTHGCLNTLHPNPRVKFKTCWGHVEELLVAGELWIDHKKVIFFPCSSATTCANRPLGVEQRKQSEEKKPVVSTQVKYVSTQVNHQAENQDLVSTHNLIVSTHFE
ncbi:hypothetical protein Taro_052750 [Colocasia esculenta]|uniref:Uncharacterized protein n=1 Tax=Colocasia esculenta TaxID=4460 RepID=A0A843XJH1_COLES|nr:hypothetical protein [Colocasia esculenta]